jgi:mRNA interferase RelE/StbE
VCEVRFSPGALEDLRKLDASTGQRVFEKVRWLGENYQTILHESLVGRLRGYYKLRVGDYRVIYRYEREPQRITVHLIGHRSQVYRL